jgi:nitrogen fixation protein NifU and related proteins
MNSFSQMDLYQQVIMDHNKKPRNFGKLECATHAAEGFNPLCGDHLWVYVQVDQGQIQEVGFDGAGCAISKASASMMTMALKGKSVSEVKATFQQFNDMLTGKLNPETDPHELGKLKVFSGIWKYPSRVKCAVLAWHALKGALDKVQTVSTE